MTRRPYLAICSVAVLLATGLGGCAAGLAVGAGASAGVASSEERGLAGAVDDVKIRADINRLWFERDIEMYRKVTLTITEGRVLLTGVVQGESVRDDAGRLSWQAVGVREVLNEIQVADSTRPVDFGRDVVIANTLRSRLLFDKQVKNINYSVDVVNGVVYLIGVAQNDTELDRVMAHAKDIEHVRNVVSYVLLRSDPHRQAQ